MEVKLNMGDKINIPENCELFGENNILTVKEKQKKEFKDGDILIARDINLIVIFKSYKVQDNNVIFHSYYNNDNRPNVNWIAHYFSHTTEEEKQALLRKLREQGLWWNSETKKLEKFRRRAKKGEKYLSITGTGYVKESVEDYCDWNDEEFDSGNYFLLDERDKAEETAKIIRETYNKRFKHGEERKLFG